MSGCGEYFWGVRGSDLKVYKTLGMGGKRFVGSIGAKSSCRVTCAPIILCQTHDALFLAKDFVMISGMWLKT